MRKYVPIQIQSLGPDGKWGVRNAFSAENSKVRGGTMSRQELISIAQKAMGKWNTTYWNSTNLRVSGVPKTYFSKGEKDD